MRALDHPSTSAVNADDETAAVTPMECSRSESDFYMVNMTVNQETKFILETVYIHPNVPQEALEYFMFQMFGACSEAIRLIFPNVNPDTETPILLCGDFNMDIMQNKSFVNFMKSIFNLDCISPASTIWAIRA
jgi:hypothetical protein